MERPFPLLDTESLFLSRRAAYRDDEPFLHGSVDDYLPESVYRLLKLSVPDEAILFNYDVESNATDRRRREAFVAENPGWKALLDFFGSGPFLADVHRLIFPAAHDGVKTWTPANQSEQSEAAAGVPVTVTFKLSSTGRGEWVQPHTDNSQKILSILLYFPDDDWQESYGGGTDVYEPKQALLKRNWHNIEAPFEWMRHRHTFSFAPNRLVFLLKTANSWHGVSPVMCPPGMRRRTMLVTIRHHDPIENKLERKVFAYLKAAALRRIMAGMKANPAI